MSTLILDGKELEFGAGLTLLRAALANDVYIPSLCFHPDLHPAEECGLCAVEVEGRGVVQACATVAEDGMVVHSESDEAVARRRERLVAILARHPHACLTCAQAEGCSLTQCSSNVPEVERCCPKFGACELQLVAAYIGIPPETPRYLPSGLPKLTAGPILQHDLELCIACTRCIRVCRDVRGVDVLEEVEINGLEVVVPRDGGSLVEVHCRFCGACAEVCPTGAITDKSVRAGDRETRLVPCTHACPAGVDVPGYLRLVSQGRFDDALAVVLARAPLPGVLGRICPAPCEDVCRRTELGGSAAIAALKRACTEHGHADRVLPESGPSTGKRVAVVGAGPSGLTAAVELRRLGHEVVMFDEQDRPGGILRSAVPSFRLPREVVDRDVERVLAMGVEFRPAVRLGREIHADGLLEEHDAVLLAVGAQRARRIELEGCDLPGAHWGVELLREAAAGRGPALSGRTLVVGGGSVAVDCAMTALRLGASKAVLCSLESQEELPAHPADLRAALDEGVSLMPSWGPARVLERAGRVAGLELVRCVAVFDATGAFAPRLDDTTRKTVEGDTVILAVGQEVDRELLSRLAELDGLFACGDARSTTTTVIDAIRSGREAALAIDRHLGGAGAVPSPPSLGRGEPRLERVEGFAARTRFESPGVAPEQRLASWTEVTAGLSRDAAMAEAARCLQCDLRLDLARAPVPPRRLTELTAERVASIPAAAGVYRLYDADRKLFAIAGAPDLREAMEQKLDSEAAAFCDYELNEMYTARESELLQRYLAEHGELPPGEDDLDDLF